MSENPTSPSAVLSDNESETPRASRRRGYDPVTSSPGRDLPAFENEDDIIGGMGGHDDEEEDDGENLFGDNMEDDYRAMPHLDNFDPRLLDEEEYDNLSMEDRMAAELEGVLEHVKVGAVLQTYLCVANCVLSC